MLASPPYMREGLHLANRALDEDEKGNRRDALKLYMDSVEWFLVGVKGEQDEVLRRKINVSVSAIISRGEEIAAQLEALSKRKEEVCIEGEEFVVINSKSPTMPQMVDEYHSKFPIVYCILTGMRCAILSEQISSCVRISFSRDDDCVINSVRALMDFDFCEHAPADFKQLREVLGIDNELFVNSMTQYSLCEMGSAGKSGSVFYKSLNGRFIIKSVTEEERNFLVSILDDYLKYMLMFPNTMLTRYLGLYSLVLQKEGEVGGAKSYSITHFVVMENVLPNEVVVPIHTRYDLKGSTKNRFSTFAEKLKPNTIYKDMDMVQTGLHLGPKRKKMLFEQMTRDCKFLKDHDIMDYSLFVGVHSTSKKRGRDTVDPCFYCYSRRSMAFKDRSAFRSESMGGFMSADKNDVTTGDVYFFGIIDMLQPYNLRKKIEHSIKSIFDDPNEISCVDPAKYSLRFQAYLRRITR